jgi:hypothetical protein
MLILLAKSVGQAYVLGMDKPDLQYEPVEEGIYAELPAGKGIGPCVTPYIVHGDRGSTTDPSASKEE